MTIAGLSLIGWVFDITSLTNLKSGLATMKVNTSLSCLLLGGALLLARNQPGSGAAKAMALSAISLGALTLLEYASGVDLSIDELLLADDGPSKHPGRMAPATATSVVILGAATWESIRGNFRNGQILTLPAAMIGLLTIVGYATEVKSFYDLVGFSSVALHTAVWILLLAAALLHFAPEQGPMRLFAGDSLGSLTARRLMPAALLTPVLLSWLSRTGEAAGYYDANVGAALVSIGMITALGTIVYCVASGLHHVDLDRKRARQAEAAVLRRLRHANVELQQFAYSISHDIRGPLATILGLARLADEDIADRNFPDAHRSVSEIARSASSLTRLVQDTLELTRTDLLEEAFSSISVARLAQQVCRDMEHPAAAQDIRLSVEADGEGEITTEPTRLKCVLHNLVENAIKYHDPRKAARWVRIGVEGSADAGICIQVADNGLGIPESNWKDVFTVYRRFHPDAAEGSGIGLALVRRQTSCLGGTIDFHSNSEGTTFTIQLPPQDTSWSEDQETPAERPYDA